MRDYKKLARELSDDNLDAPVPDWSDAEKKHYNDALNIIEESFNAFVIDVRAQLENIQIIEDEHALTMMTKIIVDTAYLLGADVLEQAEALQAIYEEQGKYAGCEEDCGCNSNAVNIHHPPAQ